jgi:DNA replication protein DnaC
MIVDMDALQLTLRRLRLSRVTEIMDLHLQKAAEQGLTHLEFLQRLVDDVAAHKRAKTVQQRIKQAKFPFHALLEDFDYDFQPTVSAERVRELAQLRFVEKHENICLFGPTGTGKTNLSVGFGLTACEAGYKVRFTTTEDLLENLQLDDKKTVSAAKLAPYLTPDILILDDFGLQPFSLQEGHAFFALVSRRYEKGSIILTSNKSFLEWGEILGGDEVLASATLDRLLHHVHIFNIKGPSYRLKDKRHMIKRAAPPRDSPPPATTPD